MARNKRKAKAQKKIENTNTIDGMAKKTGKLVKKFWTDDKSVFVN